MSDDPFKSAEFEKLFFKTAVGAFEWWPDWDALREHLFKPLVEAAAADEDPNSEAAANVRLWFQFFFVVNIQHAAVLAVEELIALAKASAAKDRHERERIARRAAEMAKDASLERLRSTTFFRRPPKRGDKKRVLTSQWVREFIDERDLFRARLETAITKLLKQGARPTLSNVAALMNMGRWDTGGKLLGSALRKWVNPYEKPKKILDDQVEEIKNRTFDE